MLMPKPRVMLVAMAVELMSFGVCARLQVAATDGETATGQAEEDYCDDAL